MGTPHIAVEEYLLVCYTLKLLPLPVVLDRKEAICFASLSIVDVIFVGFCVYFFLVPDVLLAIMLGDNDELLELSGDPDNSLESSPLLSFPVSEL